MKTTPTAEEYLFKKDNANCKWSKYDICNSYNEFAKLHLEALRSELKEFNEKTFDETIKYHNIVRYREYFERVTKTYSNNLVDQVINNRLNELK